jgi:hypothetical protein
LRRSRSSDALARIAARFPRLHAYLGEAAKILTIGRLVRARRRQLLRDALRHALVFSTWHSLSANGVGRSDAAKLTTALVEAASSPNRQASV